MTNRKKWSLAIFLFFGSICYCYSQKATLRECDLSNWPHIVSPSISNDGAYVSYCVSQALNFKHTLFIRSIKEGFNMEIPDGDAAVFTEDNQELWYMKHDSLVMLDLFNQRDFCIGGVRSFKMPDKGGMPIVAYQTTDDRLDVMNRVTGQRWHFGQVKDYTFGKNGQTLLVFQMNGPGQGAMQMRWLNFRDGRVTLLWEGQPVLKYVLSQSENKVAFVTGREDNDRHCSVWEFVSGADSASRLLVSDTCRDIEPGYSTGSNFLQYSPDGKRLFFGLYHLADSVTAALNAEKVDIWTYRDKWLQCDQLNDVEKYRSRQYLAVFDLFTHRIMRLEQEQDGGFGESLNEAENDDYVLTSTNTNYKEGYHDHREFPDIYLVDTRTGERRCIVRQSVSGLPDFSAGGKYVTWYNSQTKKFNFYNIEKRSIYSLNLSLFTRGGFYGCDAWLEGDKAILMSDQYDILQVDPEGKLAPVDITHGYGKRNQLYLRMTYLTGDRDYTHADPVKPGTRLILCAFSERTKANGFFSLTLGTTGDPELLSIRDCRYYFSGEVNSASATDFFRKARDRNIYLLFKQSATECPNLQVTKDFRTFKAMTDLAPEKAVNWLTSQLLRWKTFDGRPAQGILYKPEDFDPSKRYPVIFYFYEVLSGRLNLYLYPERSGGRMDIPWFVSHGYLVFCPDIEYTLGDPGRGIYNYVVSAAVMMKQKPWVDGKRMGMQGHSFGGYEVSLLVTRTGIFAAACEASGITDLVSFSGEAGMTAVSGHWFTENSQLRMKVPLWQDKAAYIRNSPVFGADKVTTPLLMMHCKSDWVVPWQQAMEFFTALRELGKPSYLLQYDQSGHALSSYDAMDYTRRLMQFFDHYLKGVAAPKWMSEGIPATLKGIDNGLNLTDANAGTK